MAIIDKTNLFSEARNNISALISANVSDPVSGSAEFRKWIYSREPDLKSADFKEFPLIIISPTELDIPKERASLDDKSKQINWSLQIEVISSDRSSGNNDGKGLTYMDAISNSIIQVLNDKTNRDTLRSQLIFHLNFSVTGVDTENFHDTLVYRRTFVLSFETKIQVSS